MTDEQNATVGMTSQKKIIVFIALSAVVVALAMWALPKEKSTEVSQSEIPTQSGNTENSQTVTPDQSAAVQSVPDPEDALPIYNVSDLYELFRARDGEQPFIGKKIRLIGNIDYAGSDDVVYSHNRGFLEYSFDIVGFSDSELSALKEGDNVMVICKFMGTGKQGTNPNIASITWFFRGLELHKI